MKMATLLISPSFLYSARRWSILSIGLMFLAFVSIGIIDSIEDHCEGIYNFFHNEEGLNCHRSYGYLVNPAIGNVIAQWWKESK